MTMEFFSSYDQFVANLASHHEQDHLGPFHIIQHSKIADTEFKFSQRIWAQASDCPRGRGWLVLQASKYGGLNDTLLPNRQG
jgi:hypothetical protein